MRLTNAKSPSGRIHKMVYSLDTDSGFALLCDKNFDVKESHLEGVWSYTDEKVTCLHCIRELVFWDEEEK